MRVLHLIPFAAGVVIGAAGIIGKALYDLHRSHSSGMFYE